MKYHARSNLTTTLIYAALIASSTRLKEEPPLFSSGIVSKPATKRETKDLQQGINNLYQKTFIHQQPILERDDSTHVKVRVGRVRGR